MLGITLVDWLVIFVYLIGITVIGAWAIRKVKDSTSFFISDRKFGSWMMIFFNFGTGTHSDQAVSVAAKTYRVGASGLWYQLLWIFSTPFYWVIAPMFRRMRAVTTSDFFEARFNRSVAVLYACVAIMNLVVNIGVMLLGSSKLITAITGGAINPYFAIAAMTVMFLIYGVAGGLSAAVVTDFIQGILTIVLSFLILPFALVAVGGMGQMRATLDGQMTAEYEAAIQKAQDTDHPGMTEDGRKIERQDMFALVSPEIGLFYIIVISLNGLIGYGTQPHTMGLCAAAKTEMVARIGMTCGMFIKRFCTVAWVVTGLCAAALYIKERGAADFDVDYVYGLMARDLLPGIMPGLVGLFIASMLAAVMSSCDAFMVACSALFTENVYRKLIVPNAGDRHYMIVGRVVSVLVVAVAILFAFSLESVVKGLEVFWQISAIMGLAFWAGLFWRRTTPAGAWAGTLVSFGVLLLTSKITLPGFVAWDFNAQFASSLPAFLTFLDTSKETPELVLYLPWKMIFYLTSGLIAMVAVSLATRPVAEAKLERFYACLRTPVGPDEPETEPFTLPPGVEPTPRRVLVDLPGFEIPVPSRVSVLGVLTAALAVVAFIAGVYWVFSLGA
ncbi:MAG: sodium:solute symporter family protein [Planctomycetota bacterium]